MPNSFKNSPSPSSSTSSYSTSDSAVTPPSAQPLTVQSFSSFDYPDTAYAICTFVRHTPNGFEPHFHDLMRFIAQEHPSLNDSRSIKKTLGQLRSDWVLEFDKKLHFLPDMPRHTAYAHSNATYGIWLEEQKRSNPFGLACPSSDPLHSSTVIFNKSAAIPGTQVHYVQVTKNDKSYAYALDTTIDAPVRICAAWDGRSWCVLNNELGTRLDARTHFAKGSTIAPQKDHCAVFTLNPDWSITDYEPIGSIHDPRIETVIIKHLYQLERFESPSSSKHAKASEPQHSALESGTSVKHLDVPFFTIDSASTTDIDDAIALKRHSDGSFELYVAIADASHYVPIDSPLDQRAQAQSTTFYLTHQKMHMLPPELSEGVCSLNIGQSKRALVYCARFDAQGNKLSEQFTQNTITPTVKISYEDVDAFFDAKPLTQSHVFIPKTGKTIALDTKALEQHPWICTTLNDFSHVSALIKKQLERPYYPPNTVQILGEDRKVQSIQIDERQDSVSQQIVETFMLAANVGAAQFLRSKYPYIGLFRNQSKPLENEKPKPALYQFENEGHHGLQEDTYTHFTSPIRRYCDLLVHRLIKSVLNGTPTPYTKEQIEAIALITNDNSYIAKQAQNKEQNLLYRQYLQKLVQTQTLNSTFKVNDFNENGVSLVNAQMIETFVPYFKLSDPIAAFCTHPDIAQHPKADVLQKINDTWKFKVFIDQYDWLNERVSSYVKVYDREAKPTSSSKPSP